MFILFAATANDYDVSTVCAQENFQQLSLCCNKQRESFIAAEEAAKCNPKKNACLNSVLDEYVLHKFQSVNKNLINMKYFYTKTNLGPAMCFVECIFRNEKLIYQRKSIDYDKVMDKLILAVNSTEQQRMEHMINECRLSVKDLPMSPMTTAKAPRRPCLNRPLLLVQCLRSQFMLGECPQDMLVDFELIRYLIVT
ncbi:uncharacterized protein LOC132195069 [Neocloeon triangulifer]|uniref:uncharacterized protein LOC132195069 n=1 Tax=Neocloeon triangulifer TaxID=2078957 RepID=UPI00286F5289|nr:uncharacterized protein LOC132195069 [Neocloeon triangulifer]